MEKSKKLVELVVWAAFDGKEFNTSQDCVEYENEQSKEVLKRIWDAEDADFDYYKGDIALLNPFDREDKSNLSYILVHPKNKKAQAKLSLIDFDHRKTFYGWVMVIYHETDGEYTLTPWSEMISDLGKMCAKMEEGRINAKVSYHAVKGENDDITFILRTTEEFDEDGKTKDFRTAVCGWHFGRDDFHKDITEYDKDFQNTIPDW